MALYNYVIVVTGQVEAPHDVNAKMQLLMGVSLTGRVLQYPHKLAVKLSEVEEAAQTGAPQNGAAVEPTNILSEVEEGD